MSDFAQVKGIVVNREGRAVAGATIVVVEGTSPVPEIALVCDAVGHFSLQLPSGRFTLEARGDGASRGQMTIDVAGAPVETLVILE